MTGPTSLSRLMRQADLTTQALADRLDVSASTVRDWRNGHRPIPDARVLDVVGVLRSVGCVLRVGDVGDGRLLPGCGTPFDQWTEEAA